MDTENVAGSAPEILMAGHFEPHVGKVFTIDESAVRLVLQSVEKFKINPGFRTPFCLIFAAPPGNVLREGLYRAQPEGGDVFQLHIAPMQTAASDRQEYQAMFN